MHNNAHAIALTIVSTKLSVDSMEEAAYETLQRFNDHWSDERKADLYARIAERIPTGATIPFAQIVEVVDRSLGENMLEFND